MAVLEVLFRRGVKPIHLRARRQLSLLVDAALGVTTTDERVAEALGRDVGEYLRTNRALPWIGLWRILRHLASTPGDVLLDLGCGAGRVVCISARFGFGRVIGIELDPVVAALAARNAEGLRRPRAVPEIVLGSAAEYHVPDDVTSVFLYNPFGGDVLRESLRQVIDSVDRNPRCVRVVYVNPREQEIFDATGRLQPVRRLHLSWRPGASWRLTQLVMFYDVVPSGSRRPSRCRTND